MSFGGQQRTKTVWNYCSTCKERRTRYPCSAKCGPCYERLRRYGTGETTRGDRALIAAFVEDRGHPELAALIRTRAYL
jgi:hypothetical protein